MTDEAIEFYRDNKTPIEKLVSVGVSRQGLDANAIRKAAQALYEEIIGGRKLPAIRIAREVFARSKTVKAVDERDDRQKLVSLERNLAAMEARIDVLRECMETVKKWACLPWYKRIFGRI